MYIVYDDQGTLEAGSLKTCVVSVTNWLGSQEAKDLYRADELNAAKRVFYAALKDAEFQSTTALGFTLEEMAIA